MVDKIDLYSQNDRMLQKLKAVEKERDAALKIIEQWKTDFRQACRLNAQLSKLNEQLLKQLGRVSDG